MALDEAIGARVPETVDVTMVVEEDDVPTAVVDANVVVDVVDFGVGRLVKIFVAALGRTEAAPAMIREQMAWVSPV